MTAKMIGLIISSMDSETMLSLYEGIKSAASNHKYSTQGYVIYPSFESSKHYNDGEFYIFETVDFSKFDGLIVALDTISDEKTKQTLRDRLKNLDTPVIAIDCDIDGAYQINTSNYESVKEIVFHLIDTHKKQKINYVSGPLTNAEGALRLQAYKDAMDERNLSYDGRIYNGTFFVDDGPDCIQAFLNSDNGLDFDAIVCGNDMQAISVIDELKKCGIKVPEDVAVIGFDDVSDTVQITPSVTTITKNIYDVGTSAIELLYNIWNEKTVPQSTKIDSEIVFRESCGCGGNNELKSFTKKEYLSNFRFEKLCNVYNRTFVEAGAECNTFMDCLAVIKKFVKNINPGMFSMYIHESYADIFDLDNFPTIKFDAADGKSYAMKNTILYIAGEFVPLEQLPSIVHVDFEKKEFPADAFPAMHFLNSPLHFMDQKIGFVSFGNSYFPTMPFIYFHWISSLNIMCNGIYNKMMLTEMYRTDSLTGAYNRFGLDYYWQKFTKASALNNVALNVVFTDINNLKIINDKFGHDEGDFAITTIAKALKTFETGKLKVFRYGGDEFIILYMTASSEDVEALKEQIKVEISRLAEEAQKPYELNASIGFFERKPTSDEGMIACIEEADKAMYVEKEKYHNKR